MVRRTLVLTVMLVLGLTEPTGAQPWLDHPLEADPAEVLAAADAIEVPPDAAIQFLLISRDVQFEEDGGSALIEHQVYRCFDRETARQWAMVQTTWSPWFQSRPEIRARVILPSGRAVSLSAESIVEVPAASAYEDVLTDDKVLQAPIPAMRAGAIVETVTVTRSKPCLQPSCDLGRVYVDAFDYVHQWRFRVSGPQSLPLTVGSRGVAVSPTRLEGDQQIAEASLDAIQPLERFDFYLPADQAAIPHVTYSVAKSWAQVASAYGELVQRQLTDLDLQSYLDQLPQEADRDELIRQVLLLTRDLVRYTGLALGESSIVPTKPDTVLRRGYGDCKDQSAVMVALLRARGIDADLALVRSGLGEDVMPELPGFGGFNHAVVVVAGETPLWIDPTAEFTLAGQLPIECQRRLALVINHETKELVTTPGSESADNAQYQLWKYQLREGRRSTTSIQFEATGSLAADQRASYVGGTKSQIRKELEETIRQQYGAREVRECEFSDPYQLEPKFKARFVFDGSNRVDVADLNALAKITPASVLGDLPYEMLAEEQDSGEAGEPLPPRSQPLVLREPYRKLTRYEITPPLGYLVAPTRLPQPVTFEVGPATYKLQVKHTPQRVSIDVLFDTGDGRFTADEVREFRDQVVRYVEGADVSSWVVEIIFEHEGEQRLEQGDLVEGMHRLRKLHVDHPEDPVLTMRYALAMLQLGLGDAAREVADRLAKELPEDAFIQARTAQILSHDRLGNHLALGMARERALQHYEAAVRIDPDDYRNRWNYGTLLSYDARGNYASSQAALHEAVEQFRKALELEETVGLVQAYGALLATARDPDELRALRERYPSVELRLPYLTAQALSRGKDVVAEINSLSQDAAESNQLMSTVVVSLLQEGEYATAREIYRTAGGQEPWAATTFGMRDDTKRFEDVRVASDDPRWPVQQLYAWALARGDLDPWLLPPLFVPQTSTEAIRQTLDALPPALHSIRASMQLGEFSPQARLDRVSTVQLTKDCGEKACQVRAHWKVGDNDLGEKIFQVMRVDDQFRIIGFGQNQGRLGRYFLQLIDEGDTAHATSWWGPLVNDAKGDYSFWNPFAGHPVYRFSQGIDVSDMGQLRRAAAMWAVQDGAKGPAVELVQQAVGSAAPVPKLQLQRALIAGHLAAGRPGDAVEVARQLQAEHAKSDAATALLCETLLESGEPEASIQFAEAWRAGHPKPRRTTLQLARALMEIGKVADAAAIYESVVREDGTDDALIDLIWAKIVNDEFLPWVTQDHLLEQYGRLGYGRAAADRMFVLAMIQLQRHKITDALFLIREAIRRNYFVFEPHYNLALGALATQAKLDAEAVRYLKLATGGPTGVDRVAQRFLSP